jgi:hypothetical protein
MDISSQFSVARELLQRGELEQALAAVDDAIRERLLHPIFDLDVGDALKVAFVVGDNFHASNDRGCGNQNVSIHD